MGPVTESIFFPIKSGVDTTVALAGAAQILSRQPGFKTLYHGPIVEDEKVHCLLIEWVDREALDTWTKSEDGGAAKQNLMGIVDLEDGLGPWVMFTQFKGDIAKAVEANVTELGFFSLPDDKATEDVVISKLIGNLLNIEDHPVISVGKAKGAAMGYVLKSVPEKAEEGNKVALTGVFGFDTVEDHWKWRATPEHAEVIQKMGELAHDLDVKAVDVLGEERGMFKGSGMVHAKFTKLTP